MATFEGGNGRLIVDGRLEDGDTEDLRGRCVDLFIGGAETVRIDLSRVDCIASACMGALVSLWIDMSAAGRRVVVVKASPEVQKRLDMAGLSGVLEEAEA